MPYPSKSHPAWSLSGSSYPDIPNEPSHWELFLAAEQLDEKDALKNNPKVLEFVVKNAHKFFVPTKVLRLYGMEFHDA